MPHTLKLRGLHSLLKLQGQPDEVDILTPAKEPSRPLQDECSGSNSIGRQRTKPRVPSEQTPPPSRKPALLPLSPADSVHKAKREVSETYSLLLGDLQSHSQRKARKQKAALRPREEYDKASLPYAFLYLHWRKDLNVWHLSFLMKTAVGNVDFEQVELGRQNCLAAPNERSLLCTSIWSKVKCCSVLAMCFGTIPSSMQKTGRSTYSESCKHKYKIMRARITSLLTQG